MLINIQLQVAPEQVEAVVNLLQTSGLVAHITVEDPDDQNLKPMTATDFYKRINAANLAQKEKRVFTQKALEQEVEAW